MSRHISRQIFFEPESRLCLKIWIRHKLTVSNFYWYRIKISELSMGPITHLFQCDFSPLSLISCDRSSLHLEFVRIARPPFLTQPACKSDPRSAFRICSYYKEIPCCYGIPNFDNVITTVRRWNLPSNIFVLLTCLKKKYLDLVEVICKPHTNNLIYGQNRQPK
jgi:hypothetical protein